jgi:hypothetical protein
MLAGQSRTGRFKKVVKTAQTRRMALTPLFDVAPRRLRDIFLPYCDFRLDDRHGSRGAEEWREALSLRHMCWTSHSSFEQAIGDDSIQSEWIFA